MGTAPHARGTAEQGLDLWLRVGGNPACAGNESWSCSSTTWCQEQPRMREGWRYGPPVAGTTIGTAPHARGAGHRRARDSGRQGNSPARRGVDSTASPGSAALWEQPREHGERPPMLNTVQYWTGTALHARGTGALIQALQVRVGNSPACAGSSRGVDSPARCRRLRLGSSPARAGSARLTTNHRRSPEEQPRARGAARKRRPADPAVGSSPACAGSCSRHLASPTWRREQPCIRRKRAGDRCIFWIEGIVLRTSRRVGRAASLLSSDHLLSLCRG